MTKIAVNQLPSTMQQILDMNYFVDLSSQYFQSMHLVREMYVANLLSLTLLTYFNLIPAYASQCTFNIDLVQHVYKSFHML